MALSTVSWAPVVPTRNDPIEAPTWASWTAAAWRFVAFWPGRKAKSTVSLAVIRTALGTDVFVTDWITPSITGVATAVNVVPLMLPSSTVRLVNGTLLRVALPWTARTVAPVGPDSTAEVWPPSVRAASRAMTSARACRVRLLLVTWPMSTARAVAPIRAVMASATTARTAPRSSAARRRYQFFISAHLGDRGGLQRVGQEEPEAGKLRHEGEV